MAYSIDTTTLVATLDGNSFAPKIVDGVKAALTQDECMAVQAQQQSRAAAQAEYAAQAYARSRAAEYPSIGDQLDALFHAGVFPEDMAAKIQAVKDKYPKGGA